MSTTAWGGGICRYGGLGLLVWLLAGCSGLDALRGGGAEQAVITGSVTYRQRIALSPDAVLSVQLVDVSRADAPALVLSELVIYTHGRQVPLDFELAYGPVKIEPHHRYAVQARIESGGRLRFINDSSYPVITQGAPLHVDMLLQVVDDR